MKIIQIHLPLLAALVLTFVACKKDEAEIQQQVDRLFRQSMKEVTNKNCISVNIKKETEDQYFVDAVLEDSSRFQAIAKGNVEDKMQIVETLNSTTARFVQNDVGAVCTDLVLKPVDGDSVMYQGTATLLGGEVLKIKVNPEKGWFPINDMQSLQTIMKHQLKKANNLKELDVQLKQTGENEYMANVKSGELPPYELLVVHLGTEFRYDIPQNMKVFKTDSTSKANPTTTNTNSTK